MEMIDELFVGGSIKDVSTIVYSLKQGIPVAGLYCICLVKKKKTQIQILSSRQLFSHRYAQMQIVLAGIAQGKKEAEDLFLYLLETAVQEGCDLNHPEQWI